jgi:KTSC domain
MEDKPCCQIAKTANIFTRKLAASIQPIVEDRGEIAMIEVESSNIAAIGYRSGVCQVDFHSGSRYQYFEVPDVIYHDFLAADSKGRYLNEVFKIEFAFRYEQVW